MKVSELTGAQLDSWVAKATGWQFNFKDGKVYGWAYGEKYLFSPHNDWSQGGHIIEREKIELRHLNDGWCANIKNSAKHYYGTDYETVLGAQKTVNTPLIAAMRAYVASKYGEEVPDEVQSGIKST